MNTDKPDPEAVAVYHDMLAELEDAGVENARDVLATNLIKMCLKAGILKRENRPTVQA